MDFTLILVLCLFGILVGSYGFAVSVTQLRKGFNYRFYWFTGFAWFFMAADTLFLVISLLFLLVAFVQIYVILGLTCSFCVLIQADTLKREEVEPIKLAAVLLLSVLCIISMGLLPNGVNFAPDVFGGGSISYNLYVGLLVVAALGIVWVYSCYCTYLANKRAPTALKRYSRMYFAGTFLVMLGIFSALSTSMVFPLLLVDAGIPLMVYAYSREPKLLFVLPFTALRLTVLDTEAGLPLFTHTWNRQGDFADETLFSGMLQGISGILKESLKRGEVQEIRMADAIIIAHRIPDFPVAFVLVATRPTRSLRDALRLFAERFCSEFCDCFAVPNNVEQFSGAEAIVTACFPHVPVYD